MTLLAASLLSQEAAPLTRADGATLEPKLARIVTAPEQASSRADPIVLYEREINGYLQFQAASALPAGVHDPYVSLGDRGRLSARASVDLGAVSSSQPRGALDPLRYLSGVLAVTASGVLRAENGEGQLDVDEATVGGVSVPLSVLHELVRHFSKSATHPDGFDLSDTFALPHEIVEIRVDRGQATIVQ